MGENNIINVDLGIEKLIETIGKGVGTLYKPRAIRKEADAEAYRIKTIEEAKSEAGLVREKLEQDKLDIIQQRILIRESRKLENIVNVSKLAEEELIKDPNISEEPVDKDWAVRFFNNAEDISDDQMQQLWGKILAGEIREPNTFSLRTLDALKNITNKEAEIFSRVADFAIIGPKNTFIFHRNSDILKDNGVSLSDKLLLTEIGLLNSNQDVFLKFSREGGDESVTFISSNYLITSKMPNNINNYRFRQLKFTKIGEELLRLHKPTTICPYIKNFYNYLKNRGLIVELTSIK